MVRVNARRRPKGASVIPQATDAWRSRQKATGVTQVCLSQPLWPHLSLVIYQLLAITTPGLPDWEGQPGLGANLTPGVRLECLTVITPPPFLKNSIFSLNFLSLC